MTAALPNLRHLRAFCAVASEGGFSAAARALNLSQPAITQSVHALEAEFNVALFERSGRGAVPTSAGRVCADRARRALDRLGEGLAAVAASVPASERRSLRGVSAAQLGALVAVVQDGGFGRAARARDVSRTTLHGAARQLERVTGIVLFEATSHGLRPTREALWLVRAATLAAREIEQARAELAALDGADRGATIIGTMPLARSAIIPEALIRFARARPQHGVSILDGPYESMLDALQHGRADLLIGALRESPPVDVVQEHLLDDPLAVIARVDHPLARAFRTRRRVPRLVALARFPWIAPRLGSPLRRHFDELARAAPARGVAAPIECNSLAAARGLLLASDRLMLLSARQVRYEIAAGELVALPHPLGAPTRAIGLTMRRDWRPTAAQRELIDAIREATREPGPGSARRSSAPVARERREARGPSARRRTG